MTKMKKIAAMTAALLICAGNMGYMPESTISIGGFTANAAEVAAESVKINESYFPDAIFRQYIADNFDKDGDGVLSAEEIANATELNIDACGINNLAGLEYFENLKLLSCSYNNITELDLSQNKELEALYCSENFSIESINVSNNKALKVLYCADNKLTSLDLSNNTALKYLDCYNNQLTFLNVSNCTSLTDLSCFGNKLTSLDVSNCTALTNLSCRENQLTSLDLSGTTALTRLECGKNQLNTLDVSNNAALTYLFCEENQLTSLDLRKNTELIDLCCEEEHRALLAKCAPLYPDLEDTLKVLTKQYRLFIVSNCQGGYIEVFLKTSGLSPYFEGHLCPGDTGNAKADNIRQVIQDYQLQNPVYIGDTEGDWRAAKNAGIPFVFASYGFGNVPSPDYTIKSFKELLNIF